MGRIQKSQLLLSWARLCEVLGEVGFQTTLPSNKWTHTWQDFAPYFLLQKNILVHMLLLEPQLKQLTGEAFCTFTVSYA